MEAELGNCLRLARSQGREDLAARLDEARRDLLEGNVSVVVAGEFKQGKSSLINALVKSEVCPVDDDLATAVPTIVRFGKRPEAVVHFAVAPDPPANGAAEASAEADVSVAPAGNGAALDLPPLAIPLDEVPAYVRGERGPDPAIANAIPGAAVTVRSVEVRLDRRILRTGLAFVDCPGVGGLESAEGAITLGALALAEALLFVTDASQELTRAEVSFVRAALPRCPRVLCVVSKVDLYPEWRRIVELDRQHLAAEGLDVPVLAVSSFLRLRAAATDDAAMNDESQFPALFTYLRREVVGQGAAGRLERAASEVAFATRMLRRGLQAESDVMARPDQGGHVVERLTQAAAVTDGLQSTGATWQRVLSDGIQDLVEDVKHDLRDRLRTVLQSGEQVIDRSDPKDSWAEFEAWIRRQVVAAAMASYDYLLRRAAELAEQVGEQFSQDADTPIALSIAPPLTQLEQIPLTSDFSATLGGRGNVVLSAAKGSYGGMLMFGMAGSLLGVTIPLAAPVALLISLGLGRKSVRDELVRRHRARQAEGKAALRRYVDKVMFLVDKECGDALRRTQRLLRDEFTSRARSLQQSSAEAVMQAQRVLALDAEDRARRQEEVERELAVLGAAGGGAPAAGEQSGDG